MAAAHQKYGKLKWADLIEPAIALARQGFKISLRQARELNQFKEIFVKHNPKGTAFVKDAEWEEGDTLVQAELSNTLEQIRDKGLAGFYEGPVADSLLAEMKRGGGMINVEDLKSYKAIWRKPIVGSYKEYKIITMPPPSSGGIALIQLLKSVEPFPLRRWGLNADSTVQVMVEAERRVYADRATHLGDPDFYNVPQVQLLE